MPPIRLNWTHSMAGTWLTPYMKLQNKRFQVSGVSQVQETKLKAESSKRSEDVSYLDQTGCPLAGGGARVI